jgi:predicted nuclease of predicted toxin-antitoxin system
MPLTSLSTCLRRWEAPMRILLDENFPLALVLRLEEEGYDADHIILLGIRGAADRTIVDLLNSEDYPFPDA